MPKKRPPKNEYDSLKDTISKLKSMLRREKKINKELERELSLYKILPEPEDQDQDDEFIKEVRCVACGSKEVKITEVGVWKIQKCQKCGRVTKTNDTNR